MQNSRHSSKSGSGRRTARIMVGITGVFVVGLAAVWWRLASDDPSVTIPNPVMPNPNAFDYYVAAARGIVNSKQIDDASMTTPTIAMTLEQKEAAVAQNAAAIQSLHQGFAYEYRNPPSRSFYTAFPQFAGFRRVARLLSVQSRVRAARGNWGGAAESALDAIRLGEDVPRGGVVIAKLVGVACQAIGQRPMWSTVEHLNAAQSRTAARRLEAILERHFAFADTIQEEKWNGQAGLQQMFRSINLRTALANANGLSEPGTPAMQRYQTALFLLYGKKRIMRGYTDTMDAMAVQARQPYALKLPPPVPSDPLNQMIDPVFENSRFSDVNTQAQNGLLLVSLTLRAYRLEHGRYPASLGELAPAYLKRLPDDPFALRGGFQYRVEGRKCVLYSVGPDGKDDGGTPIDDPKNAGVTRPQGRYRVKSESRGDIVAGINIP